MVAAALCRPCRAAERRPLSGSRLLLRSQRNQARTRRDTVSVALPMAKVSPTAVQTRRNDRRSRWATPRARVLPEAAIQPSIQPPRRYGGRDACPSVPTRGVSAHARRLRVEAGDGADARAGSAGVGKSDAGGAWSCPRMLRAVARRQGQPRCWDVGPGLGSLRVGGWGLVGASCCDGLLQGAAAVTGCWAAGRCCCGGLAARTRVSQPASQPASTPTHPTQQPNRLSQGRPTPRG